MSFIKTNKKKISIIGLIALILIFFSLFYQYGVIKYYDLVNKKNDLLKKIEIIDKENQRLRAEIDSLKNDDFKIEKVAREKYNMLRKGEKVFKIEDE